MAYTDSPNWYVSSDDDDEEDREYIECTVCPDAKQCSKASFRKAGCWSFRGLERCMEKVKNHLQRSTNHKISEEDSLKIAGGADYRTHKETQKERAMYRRNIKKLQADKAKHGQKMPTSPVRQTKLKCVVKPTSRAIGAIADGRPFQPVGTVVVEAARGSASSSDEVDIAVKASHLKMLGDAVSRAKHACDSMARLSSGLAGQYERESDILDAATKMLNNMLEKKNS